MTYESLPPKHSKSGRVVEIDGGKAFELASIGNSAVQRAYAEAMAKVWPGGTAGRARNARGSAGGARQCEPSTPAVQVGVFRVADESTAAPQGSSPGPRYRPDDCTVTPRASAGDAGCGDSSTGEVA